MIKSSPVRRYGEMLAAFLALSMIPVIASAAPPAEGLAAQADTRLLMKLESCYQGNVDIAGYEGWFDVAAVSFGLEPDPDVTTWALTFSEVVITKKPGPESVCAALDAWKRHLTLAQIDVVKMNGLTPVVLQRIVLHAFKFSRLATIAEPVVGGGDEAWHLFLEKVDGIYKGYLEVILYEYDNRGLLISTDRVRLPPPQP